MVHSGQMVAQFDCTVEGDENGSVGEMIPTEETPYNVIKMNTSKLIKL